MIERFNTKKNIGLAALAFVLSAAVIGPPLGTQSPSISTDATTSASREAISENSIWGLTRPAGTAATYSLDLTLPGGGVEPSTAPSSALSAKPSYPSVAVLATTLGGSISEPREETAAAPAQVSAPTQAPVAQVDSIAPVVGTVEVSRVLPGDGIGEAILQWSSIPGASQYQIFKTGTIRPSWRLFYVYPSSITSITIFDKPGSIAIYKIVAIVGSEEVFLGEAIYEPTN
jgi:hypothetical protein